jgi:putative two-component system response regulator
MMSITTASPDWVLSLIIASCGLLCVIGYLMAFALSRRLLQDATWPVIGIGELVKPLACGTLLGVLILAFRLDEPAARLTHDASQMSPLMSALLAVGLAGVCAGGWSGRPRAGHVTIRQAEMVARLCVAGNTHEDATARIAVRLALAAGYDPGRAGDLTAAASLHDVGKAGIPDAILNKSGVLDPEEQRVMQSHTRIGYRMMACSHEPMLDLAADIALHHHEHWDGSGYPTGLAGERIPLTSRVVGLAEMFDELLGVQPDQPPPTFDEVVHRLRETAGVQFDPRLVTLLLADLPGMVALRNAGGAPVAQGSSEPLAAWLRPGRLQALPGHITV